MADAKPVEWVCDDCARALGGLWPEGRLGTFHTGRCGVCGQVKAVTSPRDWRLTLVRPEGREEARAEPR